MNREGADFRVMLAGERLDRRRLFRVGGGGLVVCVAPLLAACDLPDTLARGTTDRRFAVAMTRYNRFDPGSLTIPQGSTVVWTNDSAVVHTVSATNDPDFVTNPSHALIPDGAEPWDSGNLYTNDGWARTFDIPGDYIYYCRYHEAHGMIGTITVEE